MSDIRSQELHCHSCQKYVQFRIDLELDGNHVLDCPNCGHEHCRVVKDGVITDIRWDQRNGQTHTATTYGTTSVSTWTSYNSTTSGTASTMLYESWMNTGTGGAL